MTELSPDNELVADYVARGSENAFRALVTRYLGLVYGTALRQVGDRGAAEEIAQNVFMALARKAPRLRGMETLAGWMHRTTILESRARSRADLRRARREEAAAELGQIEFQGACLTDPREALLDEALLHLRESDRAALMLRFWDERPFKDVGAALGVGEEAARKRVSRALDDVAGFFTRRGFQVGATGCATLLAGASQAAVPNALAATVTKAALAAGASSGPLSFLLLNTMALTKTQTAVVCAIMAAIPLAVQQHAEARIDRDLALVQQQASDAEQFAIDTEQQVAAAGAELAQVAQQRAETETRLASVVTQRAALPAARVYQWNDSAALMRFPKSLLKGLALGAVANRHGSLTPEIKEVLQLTPTEADQAQAALNRFVAAYNAARTQSMRRVEPTEKELKGRRPEDVRVFELPAIPFQELREALFAELTAVMGADREKLFRLALTQWMPTDNGNGMNTGWAVFGFPYRLRLHRPPDDHQMIPWTVEADVPARGMMSAAFRPEDVPDFYRPHIQDWIALAEANALKERIP